MCFQVLAFFNNSVSLAKFMHSSVTTYEIDVRDGGLPGQHFRGVIMCLVSRSFSKLHALSS